MSPTLQLSSCDPRLWVSQGCLLYCKSQVLLVNCLFKGAPRSKPDAHRQALSEDQSLVKVTQGKCLSVRYRSHDFMVGVGKGFIVPVKGQTVGLLP